MVTSGVVPGIVLFKLFEKSLGNFPYSYDFTAKDWDAGITSIMPLVGLLVTLASCYRLANFNIDSRQTESFIGLPVPANTLFILSLPMILLTNDVTWVNDLILNPWFLIGLTLFSCYMLNAEIPLFSLKMKTYGFKENAVKYVFLIISVIMLTLLQFMAIPLIIVLYVLISLFMNLKK